LKYSSKCASRICALQKRVRAYRTIRCRRTSPSSSRGTLYLRGCRE
jgi:hypothetical protein